MPLAVNDLSHNIMLIIQSSKHENCLRIPCQTKLLGKSILMLLLFSFLQSFSKRFLDSIKSTSELFHFIQWRHALLCTNLCYGHFVPLYHAMLTTKVDRESRGKKGTYFSCLNNFQTEYYGTCKYLRPVSSSVSFFAMSFFKHKDWFLLAF